MTYGANSQRIDFTPFPLQVIDNVPPTLTYFYVVNKTISSQGGKTDVILRDRSSIR